MVQSYKFKRASDFFLSFFGLVFCAPLLVFISFVLLVTLPGNMLFKQQRVGMNTRKFVLYKFRTMKTQCDMKGNLLSDEERLTAVGIFLRKMSLDELPELWNVLKGDMSFVGPRPLLPEYVPLYSPEQTRRHVVKPGITGWAQINGRNAISWEERFKLDVWYVDHQSILLDIKILFITIVRLFQRKGINAEGHVTMPKFTGSIKRGVDE